MAGTPTPRQLSLLKRLAAVRGVSFAYPTTFADADLEIKRLKTRKTTGRTFAERDRATPEVHGTGRFSESTGFGAHASYSHDRAGALGEHIEPPVVTDRQEHAIIEHQHQTGDTTVSATVTDAAAYLDAACQRREDPPTARQLAHLNSLEAKQGLPLSRPASRQAASRRIERLRSPGR